MDGELQYLKNFIVYRLYFLTLNSELNNADENQEELRKFNARGDRVHRRVPPSSEGCHIGSKI